MLIFFSKAQKLRNVYDRMTQENLKLKYIKTCLLRRFHNRSTPSSWRDGVIDHFFRAWFVKQQNNWRDGVKVILHVMVWLALFLRRHSWSSNIIGVMTWKWCMAWLSDRSLFLEVNREFCLKVQWCKLRNNKYMIALAQITNTEIFAFMAVFVFKLFSRKVLCINRKNHRNC